MLGHGMKPAEHLFDGHFYFPLHFNDGYKHKTLGADQL